MAYIAKGNYGYGDGTNGDVANPSGQINSYANVTAYTAESITIGTPSNGVYEKFTANSEIMIHVSATNGTNQEFTYLGKYVLAKIKSVAGSVLAIDTDFTKVLPVAQLSKYQVQAITVAKFQNMELKTSTITPPQYSVSTKYGGILLAKCSDTITFSGGKIDLVDKGIPAANLAYRPLTTQEKQGNADTDKYSGWENHITIREFLLNAGDGACMLWAKNFAQTGTASRIGGTAAGAQFKRGNKGGSTIALICQDMQNFDPSIISKTKNSGQGLGRCYITSKTKLRNDEGLYAYDCISDPTLVMRELNIKNFGDGSLGDVTNPTLPLNNYAKVVNISSDGKTIAYNNKTTNGMAQIGIGSTILFHVSKHTDSTDMRLLGKFILAKILSDDGNSIVVDTPVTKVFDVTKMNKYNCQIISLAQFNNLTINTEYNKTTAWNDNTKIGGICAISCKGICDLEKGEINVEGKGGGNAYAREGLAFIGNAQMTNILPLGQGHGSVFLLADYVKTNENSRVGAWYTGAALGGTGNCGGYGSGWAGLANNGGGYSGIDASGSGSGAGGGSNGGYGSNAVSPNYPGLQGGHIYAVINVLNRFSMANWSSGATNHLTNRSNQYYSGSGYGCGGDNGYDRGAGGGYNGGGGTGNYNGRVSGAACGGGSAGWIFFHVNQIKEYNNAGVAI